MGYIITTTRGVITEQFDTIDELNNFTLNTVSEASASGLQTNQYIWAAAESIDTYFSGSNEIIDETYFRFIYTTEQFENLSAE
jgi:hypothetical protein